MANGRTLESRRGSRAVTQAWCFQCRREYAAEVAECLECAVPTVGHPPADPDTFATDSGPQVAYELHAWTGASRAEVENRLDRASVSHVWQGPSLLVLEADEDEVDAIIEAVDDEFVTELASSDVEGGRVGFDLGVRNEELHTAVGARLAREEIDYELLGNGFLLVDAPLEDQVGDWIEEIQAELRGTASFGPGVEGVDSHTVVESLFLAADTLRRNTRDARAQRRFLDAASLARDMKLPFGYEARMWRSVLDHVAILEALIEDTGDDALVEDEAGTLRHLLHAYV